MVGVVKSCTQMLASPPPDRISASVVSVVFLCPRSWVRQSSSGLRRVLGYQLCIKFRQSRLPVIVKDEHSADHGVDLSG